MEKYGVKEQEKEKSKEEKTAQEKNMVNVCPKCKLPIRDIHITGGIKICPNCGTKPFEV